MSMNLMKLNVIHEKMGTLMSESFMDQVQFKIQLKTINGCLIEKKDLTLFNGKDYFLHIPYRILVDSVITTSTDEYTLTEHMLQKSKMEA
jgi:hypothetical protein